MHIWQLEYNLIRGESKLHRQFVRLASMFHSVSKIMRANSTSDYSAWMFTMEALHLVQHLQNNSSGALGLSHREAQYPPPLAFLLKEL